MSGIGPTWLLYRRRRNRQSPGTWLWPGSQVSRSYTHHNERWLIAERVKAGLRNARAKGKRLGRPQKVVDAARIAQLRAQGLSCAKIAGR